MYVASDGVIQEQGYDIFVDKRRLRAHIPNEKFQIEWLHEQNDCPMCRKVFLWEEQKHQEKDDDEAVSSGQGIELANVGEVEAPCSTSIDGGELEKVTVKPTSPRLVLRSPLSGTKNTSHLNKSALTRSKTTTHTLFSPPRAPLRDTS